MKHIVVLLAVMLLCSCNNDKNTSQTPYIFLNLADNIKVGEKRGITLNDIAIISNVTPVETNDSTLVSFLRIGGTTHDKILIYDERSVFFVNKDDGQVSLRICKVGNGPGEYINIGCVTVSEDNERIYLFDLGKRRIMEYDFNGCHIKTTPNDSIAHFKTLNDGNHLVSYSPFSNMDFCMGLYDKDWNLIRTAIPRSYDPTKMAVIPFNLIQIFNGEGYFREMHSDTLFIVNTYEQAPAIILNKGAYKMPLDLMTDLGKLSREYQKYIMDDSGLLASRFYFENSSYDRKEYFNIWDVKTQELIYRAVTSERGGASGVPVSINGIVMNVWPTYAIGNYIYCVINTPDAMDLMPWLAEDSNPVILEMRVSARVNR